VEILYVGKRGGMEEQLVPEAGLELETLSVSGIQDEPWRNIPLLYRLPASVLRAVAIVRRFQPDVVFGTGGYVAGVTGAAAVVTRRPLVLQFPDAVPGRAVRRLARRAAVVCSAYDESAERLPGARVVNTGNPLRPEFARRGVELRRRRR